MARQRIEKWIPGDRVTKGDNEGVVVYTHRNGPMVRVLKGNPKGYTFPEGWTPQLGEGSYQQDCRQCGRAFKSLAPFEPFCATCSRGGNGR